MAAGGGHAIPEGEGRRNVDESRVGPAAAGRRNAADAGWGVALLI